MNQSNPPLSTRLVDTALRVLDRCERFADRILFGPRPEARAVTIPSDVLDWAFPERRS